MLVLATLVATVVSLVIVFYKYWFGYWKRQGIPYIEPSIPFGNTKKLFTQQLSFGQQFAAYYNYFKSKGEKHGGVFVFARPFYVPVNPEVIKSIVIKDFNNFVDRGFFVDEHVDPLSAHLFSLEGIKWKNLRNKLSATFSSGKMKMMFHTMADTAIELSNIFDQSAISEEPIEIKEYVARFTTDVISSCAFGLETNSLKNPDAKFRYFGIRIFKNSTWENIKQLIQFICPARFLRWFKFKSIKPDVAEFMTKSIEKTIAYREQNNIFRQDVLHMLIQLKNRGKLSDDNQILPLEGEKGVINFQELAAQCLIFFAAGYETSSTTITFALYEVARNKTIQNKLHKEIRDVLSKHNDKLSYEALGEMTYLDKVISETLRIYPSLPFLNRICTAPYKIPGTDLTLEEGTMVVIPILGIQLDPEYFPEPEKFDPERFNEEVKKTRPATTWLAFGDGPRNCIGSRFGLMQTKIGMVTMLRNFEVSINSQTVEPLEHDTTSFIYNTKNKIFLNIKKIM